MGKIFTIFATERPRLFLWSPVMLMLGIGGYFTLADEPSMLVGQCALSFSAVILALLWRYRLRAVMIPIFLISLGFFAAQFRAHEVATPLLVEEVHNRVIEGTIDEIEPIEEKEKLVLSHLSIEGVAPEATPLRVRVSFRHQDESLSVGDRIRLTANLFPLQSPIMPGSFEFARHFYFRSIGGNGFSMRGAGIIDQAENNGWHSWLNNLRHRIGANMRSGMPGEVGTVAAAMTVGETGPIPEDVKSTLRDSGLAHMLAIAGLHLGIVTAIIFYNVRLLLTFYPPLALRIRVKKIAAIFALASAFIYLMLAGGPIPAQRAFIMVVFLFTAVLLDRKAVTLRTLSIAAMIILLLFPESMFGPSFQMSFAATLAIVSLYERFGRNLSHSGGSFLARFWVHLLGIIMTSLVATMATAPFVLYHFNRFAIFGLLANMVVVPLATFVIMPGMVLALILMPFGLQWIGYAPLEFGTDIMIRMARWVTNLPYASLHLPSPTEAGLACATFGLLWLCLMMGRHRLFGIGFIALGLATISQHAPVDVLVSSDAHQVMVRLDSGHYTTLKGTGRSYNVKNWLRSEGEDELVPPDNSVDCDKALCTYTHNGHVVKMVKKPEDDEALYAACSVPSDVVIAWRYLEVTGCPGAAGRIARGELEAYGAHALWLDKGSIRIAHTHELGGWRPWQPRVKLSDAEE